MQTVDITPTWQDLADALVILVTEGTTSEARATGRAELLRALRCADALRHIEDAARNADDPATRRTLRGALADALALADANARPGRDPLAEARRLLKSQPR